MNIQETTTIAPLHPDQPVFSLRYCQNDTVALNGTALTIYCLAVKWQFPLLFIAGVLTIPLYILVLRVIFKLRGTLHFMSPLFTLTFSQGCVDIAAFLTYTFFTDLRHVIKPFFWYLKDTYLPSFGFACIHIFFLCRILGCTIIALQRLASVSFPNSMMNYAFNGFPKPLLIGSHWVLPILANIPVLTQFHTYDDDNHMHLVIPLQDFSINSLSMAIMGIVAYVVVTCCLTRIFVQMAVDIATNNQGRRAKKEMRITFMMIGMIFGFYICTTFHIMQWWMMRTRDAEKIQFIYRMRLFYPTMNALFSLCTPWLIIFFNDEVWKRLFHTHAELERYRKKNMANTV